MEELSLKALSLGSETVEGIIVVTTWIEKILTDLKVCTKHIDEVLIHNDLYGLF